MIIYKTTNIINDKIYVGSDMNNNSNYYGSGKLLIYAIKKYGKENFKKEILEECKTLDDLKIREGFWIKKLESNKRDIGYNISDGYWGGNTLTNHPNLNEISEKISKAHIGKILSKNTRKKLSKSLKGKKSCNKYKVKINGIVYNSIGEASEKLNINYSTLRNRIKSKTYEKYELLSNKQTYSKIKIKIDNIVYNSLAEASRKLNIDYNIIKRRAKSNEYKNYEKIK